MKNDSITHEGPLNLQGLADPRATGRLRGHSTSEKWLPDDTGWHEMEALREEQLRLRAQVATDLDALAALDQQFTREDAEYRQRLQDGHRNGDPAAVKDDRTPPAERVDRRKRITESLAAGVAVLADHADRVVAAFRQHEDEWLANLRAELVPAEEKRREAERLVEEARAEEWRIHKLGQWIQQTTDDGPMGRVPAPIVTGPPPPGFNTASLKNSLERPWHRALVGEVTA